MNAAQDGPPPQVTPPPTPHAGDEKLRLELPLDSAGHTCTFVFDGGLATENEDGWYVVSIKSAATADGGACAAGELPEFDDALATHEVEAFEGGGIAKPGKRVETPNMLRDLNFDGYSDLCLIDHQGAYAYGQACWLYEPATKRFRRYAKLDPFIGLEVDAKAKELRGGHRLGGPEYQHYTLVWKGGEMVVKEKVLIDLGAQPNGAPLPPGFRWEQVFSEIGGKLVKVREGMVRAP